MPAEFEPAIQREELAMTNVRTIAMYPEPGAWGPTNNLVAIGQVLRNRGHRVVFVVEESFRTELEARGFEEALMRTSAPPAQEEAVGEAWSEFIRVTAPEFRKPTIEQLETVIQPIWAELVSAAEYSHDRLMSIWNDVSPDIIVSDNVTGFPAVTLAGVPWVRMVSASPLELPDQDLPPVFSGYPTNDRTGWLDFSAEYRRLHDPLIERLSEFNQNCGAAPLPPGQFQYESPWSNMYAYPLELDYLRASPLGDTWSRLDSSVRVADAPFDIAERVGTEGSLIYLSLGSLGSVDVALMQRLIDTLSETSHRVIVSMGPLHGQIRLAPNMYGEAFLPQTAILPHCDLLITHGGNNTLGEAFTFGLPAIVLPLFWDQYDNAQRVHELGFGVRLDTYAFDPDHLRTTIDDLLADASLRARMKQIASRVSGTNGQITAADTIERILAG